MATFTVNTRGFKTSHGTYGKSVERARAIVSKRMAKLTDAELTALHMEDFPDEPLPDTARSISPTTWDSFLMRPRVTDRQYQLDLSILGDE